LISTADLTKPAALGGGHFQANVLAATLHQPKKVDSTILTEPSVEQLMLPMLPNIDSLVKTLTATLPLQPGDTAAVGTEKHMDQLGLSPHHHNNSMSASNSADLLSASPIFGYNSFDTQSLDELATPDELTRQNFIRGIRNINYDFDYSDNSADTSVAEDNKVETKSPVSSPLDMHEFDPLLNKDHEKKPLQLNTTLDNNQSLLDGDSPSTLLLESPLKPVMVDYKGFSSQGCNIPTISCNTGDFSSLNYIEIDEIDVPGTNTNELPNVSTDEPSVASKADSLL
jgi:Rab5 GDP/GTP exchange factor